MNLDILRTEWAARDAKLDGLLRLNNRYLREGLLERKRAELMKRVPFGPVSIFFWVLWVIAFGLFIANHITEARFLLPAIALQAWTIWMGATSIRQRVEMQALDFSRPLVEVQRRLEELRVDRLRTLKWAMLTGQVVWWVPFVIVLFKGLFGADLYTNAWLRTFFAVNLAVGIAAIPVAIAVARYFAKRFRGSGRLRQIGDALAGEDLAHARQFLAKLERFEKD